MLDNMSDGRLIAGFAPGSGRRPSTQCAVSRDPEPVLERSFGPSRLDEPGSIEHEGRHYPCATSIRGRSRRRATSAGLDTGLALARHLVEIAKRGYCYFLSSRSHGKETARCRGCSQKCWKSTATAIKP